MNHDSVVVMAGVPHWPNAVDGPRVRPEPIDAQTRDAVNPPVDQAAPKNTVDEEQESEAAQVSAFRPVWEVDRLAWPEACDDLYASESEYFRHAGDKLQEASRQGLRVLAIASSQAGEGCTTLAMCLARAVAAAGGRVALLDGNVEHPVLAKMLGIDLPGGWQDVVADRTDLSEVAVVSAADGITLFPLAETHEPLKPARVSEVLRQTASAADLVILDAGPLDTADEGLFESGPACPINAAIVVRDLRTTTEHSTMVTAAALRRLGIEAVGIAENYAPDKMDAAA